MAHIVKRTLRARGLIEEGGIISQEPILWLSEVIAQGPSRAFYKERLLCFEGLEEVSLVSFLNILSEIQRMEFYGALREVLFFKSDNPILLKNKVLLLAHLKAFETHFSPLFLSFDEIEQYILMVYYHALTEHGIDVRMKVDAIVKHLEENQSQAESLVESLYKDRDEVDSILIGHTSCRGLSKERVLAECRSFMKYYGHMDENFQHRVIAGMYRLWQREAIDEPLMAMMRVYPEEKRYLVSLMRDHGPIETIGEALKAVVECLTKPTLVDTSILERDFGTICFLYPRKSHLVNLLKLFQSLDIETRKPTIKVSQLSKREWEASSVLAFSFKKSCIAEKQVGIDFEGGELAYRYRRSIDLVAHEHKAYFDLDFLVNGIVEVDSDFFLCDFYQFLSYAEKKIPITEDDLRTVIDFHRSATKKRDLGLVYTDKYLQVHGCLLRTIYHELSRTCVATLLRKFEGSSFHFDNLYSRVMLLEDREDSAPEAKKNRNFK